MYIDGEGVERSGSSASGVDEDENGAPSARCNGVLHEPCVRGGSDSAEAALSQDPEAADADADDNDGVPDVWSE